MKRIDVSKLVEEMVDERVHCLLLEDGYYYLSIVEENDDEFPLYKSNDVADIYEFLSSHGLC